MLTRLYKKTDRKAADSQKDNIFEIAITNFCFKNSKIIKSLDQRGDAIREGDEAKIEKMGKKVQALIEKDKSKKNKIIRPVSAFVTFKSIKGSDIALKLLEMKDSKGNYPQLFSDSIRCRRADNPSDIRWENKQTRFKTLLFKNMGFAVVVLAVLYYTYGWFFFPMLQKS